MVAGGTALVAATKKIVDKGSRIAAHLLETAEQDISFKDGKFTVAGTDRGVGLLEVAQAAFLPARLPRGLEPGLYETGTYDRGAMTLPDGSRLREPETDPGEG